MASHLERRFELYTPVDGMGGLSDGLQIPEDPQQNLLLENPLTADQNLPQSPTGEIPFTQENIHQAGAEQPVVSPQMEQVVKKLTEVHGVDLSQQGTSLVLEKLDVLATPEYWQFTNVGSQCIYVVRYLQERLGHFSIARPELNIVFTIGKSEWELKEVDYSERQYEEFMQAMEKQGLIVMDEKTGELLRDIYVDGQFPKGLFSEYWAQHIEQEGWMERAQKRDSVPHLSIEE